MILQVSGITSPENANGEYKPNYSWIVDGEPVYEYNEFIIFYQVVEGWYHRTPGETKWFNTVADTDVDGAWETDNGTGDMVVVKKFLRGTLRGETGTVGTQAIANRYPVEEGLTAGTTKQTNNPNLEPIEDGTW